MEAHILLYINENTEELIERWLQEIKDYRVELKLHHMSNETYLTTNRKFILALIDSMSVKSEEQDEKLKQFAHEHIKLGWPLQYVTKGLQLFKKILIESLQSGEHSSLNHINLYSEIQNWIDPIIDQLIAEYAGSWENTTAMQQLALRELSAPLIPVFDGISVMPLIGTIDTERAKLIMENLLSGVIKHESQVVLIDITGVPVVDTMVAHHLIQASEAVRLVGAKPVLVGIRPEIAQTIVNLGIQLGEFATTSSLRKGIQLALTLTNRQIVALEHSKSAGDL